MRRALGPTRDLVAAIALAGLALGAGCSHEARPVVAPEEHAPLPPASGSPIGYLVEDAGELKLSDDQLTKLKAIDEDLAAKLAVLDGQLRGASPAAPAPSQSTGRRGRGFRGGGRQGGMAGRTGGGGSGSAGGRGRRSQAAGSNASVSGQVTEERAADVRAALDSAFALLDAVQRVVARRVLADHGVDLDAGRPTSKPTPAEPEQPAEPDEPDTGSDAGSSSA
jgi:hypothetical protein